MKPQRLSFQACSIWRNGLPRCSPSCIMHCAASLETFQAPCKLRGLPFILLASRSTFDSQFDTSRQHWPVHRINMESILGNFKRNLRKSHGILRNILGQTFAIISLTDPHANRKTQQWRNGVTVLPKTFSCVPNRRDQNWQKKQVSVLIEVCLAKQEPDCAQPQTPLTSAWSRTYGTPPRII